MVNGLFPFYSKKGVNIPIWGYLKIQTKVFWYDKDARTITKRAI